MAVSAVERQDRLPMRSSVEPRDVLVSFRSCFDRSEVSRSWQTVSLDALENAAPWRTFRWWKGQRHYSGWYWCATEQGHVVYESRLELARLLFADFDQGVRRIVAQPFLLRAEVEGRERKHVPDYLLVTDEGPVVVDVKPARRLSNPAVTYTFAWTKAILEERGWRHEVATEPPATELENVAFLAGYRRSWMFDPDLISELSRLDLSGFTFGEACRSVQGWASETVRSALLHMLWRKTYKVDLARPLSAELVLERGA
jgi:hypothetical protein